MSGSQWWTRVSRRDLLKAAGLTATAVGLAPSLKGDWLTAPTARGADPVPDLFLVGTDGWISLPPTPAIGQFHPDVYAPPGLSTYMFGFRNVTGLSEELAFAQKNKAQHSAPLFWAKEGERFIVRLTNVGLAQRPDLFDAHTLHWHGFKNVIAFFDGEPSATIGVPAGQSFNYVYMSHDPGTYMYHCHVEDTEHVQMGMTGIVFVRPKQDENLAMLALGSARPAPNDVPFKGFAYNCGDGSTGFDREFTMFLSEVWAEAHWADAHIQLPEWSDYRADFSLLNGRVFPDTVLPHGAIDPIGSRPFLPYSRDDGGDLLIPDDRPDLQYQPHSSLITCEPGENVLLRFANLGFKEVAMTLTGIKLRVVGRDATLMRGRDGTDSSYESNTLAFGAGESFDTIFTAPPHSTGVAGDPPDRYVLFNRTYTRANNLIEGGGQRTEVHVHPTGTLAAQQFPNDWGM
jgi:FtsP/CotA-like multicopper oxidase with cupredoxin domain